MVYYYKKHSFLFHIEGLMLFYHYLIFYYYSSRNPIYSELWVVSLTFEASNTIPRLWVCRSLAGILISGLGAQRSSMQHAVRREGGGALLVIFNTFMAQMTLLVEWPVCDPHPSSEHSGTQNSWWWCEAAVTDNHNVQRWTNSQESLHVYDVWCDFILFYKRKMMLFSIFSMNIFCLFWVVLMICSCLLFHVRNDKNTEQQLDAS